MRWRSIRRPLGSENGVYDLHCLTALEIWMCRRVLHSFGRHVACCWLVVFREQVFGRRGFATLVFLLYAYCFVCFCVSRVTALRRLSSVSRLDTMSVS